ncbi:MAG: hypothetical protein RLZZ502_1718 [Pseudomonadota bacterium]
MKYIVKAIFGLSALAVSTVVLAQSPATNTNSTTPAASGAHTKERKLDNGLILSDQKLGEGAEATNGKAVMVHYTGWLYDPKASDKKGKQFDSSRGRQPFGFIIGGGRVIKGWELGVAGMKVDGQRTLIIPPELGYGERGAGGVIPPNATLLFEVELLKILN